MKEFIEPVLTLYILGFAIAIPYYLVITEDNVLKAPFWPLFYVKYIWKELRK